MNVFCGMCLGLSVLFICIGIALAGGMHRSEFRRSGLKGARRALSPFQSFVVCFFVAAAISFFPVLYFSFFGGEGGFLRVVKSLFMSVHTVLRAIVLDGDFTDVQTFITGAQGLNPTLGAVYSVYMCVVMIAAPVVTAGFLLSFFREASAMIRYTLRPCRELFVMSELNERSLALARNILSEKTFGRTVIFTDVFETNEETSSELRFAARQIGAICSKKDITDIGLKARTKCGRKLYFIGENEDENIGQALEIIARDVGTRIDRHDTELYVFSVSAESEALLTSADSGNFKVRRIDEKQYLALAQMRSRPIFGHALPADERGIRKIRLAIVGLGGYGRELLKTALWCGQMPGYELEVHAFDLADGESRLRACAPELVTASEEKEEYDARYDLIFHNRCDVGSPEFMKTISSIGELSGVYVSLGDDERDIGTAMNIRRALGRKYDKIPPIYAIVYSASKSEVVAKSGGLVNMEGKSYGITFIGDLRERYTPEQVEQTELERIALKLHVAWAETTADEKARKERVDEATRSFERYEYYRRSSIARAVYRELRESLGFRRMDESTPEGKANNDILRDYEHRRWNTYLRSEGYVKGTKRDPIAKTHSLLVPFDRLPDDVKAEDDF